MKTDLTIPEQTPVTPHELCARAVTAAARAAFDPRGDAKGVTAKEVIATCAALIEFLDLVSVASLTTAQWREVVKTLGVDPTAMMKAGRV